MKTVSFHDEIPVGSSSANLSVVGRGSEHDRITSRGPRIGGDIGGGDGGVRRIYFSQYEDESA